MRYSSLQDFLQNGKATLAKGPVAMIFVEDMVEVEMTIAHHQVAGFKVVLVFAPTELELSQDLIDKVHRIDYPITEMSGVVKAVNAIINVVTPGTWLYYCFNGEFLFHPFCEDRSINEMLTFQTEERRDAILTYVIDLYAGDLYSAPNAVSLNDMWLDRSGYYALARTDMETGDPKERQLDFFGGLRWRFEEHIPQSRRKIDRISLFRAKPGLKLRVDHTFNDQEYNTYACPWHNNITAAIVSFRTAKALKSNPGSTFDIETFKWHNSTEFTWTSQQLLDLGLMEPGQWF